MWGKGNNNPTDGDALTAAVGAVDPARLNSMNIHATQGSYAGAWGYVRNLPGYNMSEQSWVVTFSKYWDIGSDYAWSEHLAHEIGHNLDLKHTFNHETGTESDPDYLSDVFGTGVNKIWPHNTSCSNTNSSPNDGCTNNILGGKNASYLSPKQMAKIHRALALKSVRRYVKNCAYGTTPLQITANETWDFDMKLYTDVVVKPGVTLTIKCKVLMPEQAKIIVERAGQLIVDGGTITTGCDNLWKGIEVWGNRAQRQLTTYQGKVQVINGGSIENANEGIATIKYNTNGTPDWNYTGGIVQCNNGKFRNNFKGVAFLSYQNTYANGQPALNVSSFINCTFETTTLLPGSGVPDAFVSLYDVDGVRFWASTFRNTAFGYYAEDAMGAGITSWDAKYTVDRYCTSGTIPCTSWLYNNFQGLTYGINANYNSGNLRNITATYNIFTNVQQGIQCTGGAYSNISYNTITVPQWGFGGPVTYPYAVRTNGATNFSINYNTINGAGTQADYNLGIIVENSGNSASTVKGNTLAKLKTGTQTQQNNGSGSTGLQISCNAYNTSFANAWSINPESPTGSLPAQGQCGAFVNQAGNTWNYSSTSPVNQIYSTIPFTYNARNNAGSTHIPTYVSSVVSVNQCGQSNANSCSTGGGGGGGDFVATIAETDKKSRGGIKDKGDQLRELNEKIQEYLATDSLQGAIELLKQDGSPESKKTLALTYLQYRQFDKLQALSTEIKANGYFEKDQEDIFNILNTLYSGNKTIFNLDASQENLLRNKLSADNPGKYNAQSILSLAKGEKFYNKIEQIQGNEAEKKVRTATSIHEAQSLNIPWLSDNMPNPFSGTTTIEVYVPGENVNGNIIVYDALGSQLATYSVQKNRNKIEVNSNDLSKGVYFYSLELNGEKVITKTMVLIK